MHKTHWLIIIFLVLIAGVLRFYNLSGRMPFGWDQERDITNVVEMINTHRPKLIGPIVKGEGGFFLGPLYYYLLLPGQLRSHFNPLALGNTSVLLDLLSLIFFAYFLKQRFSFPFVFGGTLLYVFSWFLIQNSAISWNVSLLLPYVTLSYLLFTFFIKTKARIYLYILALLAGFAFHIHLSLVWLIPFFFFFFWRDLPKLTDYSFWFKCFILFILPLTPLILFDFRHQFINYHLFLKFFTHSSFQPAVSWLKLIETVFSKWFLTLSFWFMGKQILSLGIGIFVFLFLNLKKDKLARFSLLFILSNLLALLFLKDPNFAEYYFLPSLIPAYYLFLKSLELMPKLISFVFLVLILISNLMNFNFQTQPFSLRAKTSLLNYLKLNYPNTQLQLQLPLSRQFGFNYLIKYFYFPASSQTKAWILEATNDSVNLPPHSKLLEQKNFFGYKLVIFIVE